jgi:putative endonuclease
MIRPEELSTLELGSYGENLAKEFLKTKGYKIVMTNFSVRLGRNFLGHSITGELDIVAYDKETLCFIEVKTRRTDFLAPEKAVDLPKQRQISRVAKRYREIFKRFDEPIRFDVVAVLIKNSKINIELKKNFFQLITKFHYSWQRYL